MLASLVFIPFVIIYIQKLLDSGWLKKGVQLLCNTSANYKWVLIGSKTIEANSEPIRLELLTGQTQRNKMTAGVGRFGESKNIFDSCKFLPN